MNLESQPSREPSKILFSHPCLRRLGIPLLALVPLVFLIVVIAHFAVDVPYVDQWELVPLLEKSYQGELTLRDFWAQHNEHRLLFPRMIMLTLARLTGWNQNCELALNLLLALGLLAVLARQVNRTARQLGWSRLTWSIPAASVVVFSLCQYENWLWGWQMQMFLNLLTVVSGLLLLADGDFRWSRFAAAAGLGVVATYSFADGILFWPIGFGVLVVVTAGARERKAARGGWLLASVVTLGTYLYHYHKPDRHPSLTLVFEMPVEYAIYVFKYLGSICDQGIVGLRTVDGTLDGLFGCVGTLALAGAGWMLIRKHIAGFRTLLPYFAISLYSVGSALFTGVGRLGLSTDQALSSRYGTMVIPLWVSLLVFLFLLARGPECSDGIGSPARKPAAGSYFWNSPITARWLFGGILALLALGSVTTFDDFRYLSRARTYGRMCLTELAAHPDAPVDITGLSAIHPEPQVIVERCPVLVRHRLSLFRDRK